MYFEWHIQSKISSSVALHHVCHPFGMLIPWTNAVFGPVQPLVECNQEIRAASEYLVFVCSHIWYVWETRLYLWDNALFVLTAGRNSQRSDFFLISAVLSWVLIFDLEQAQKRSLIQKNSNYTIFFYFFLSFFWNEVQRIVHFGRYVCTVHRYKYMYLGDTETFSTAQVCVCVCVCVPRYALLSLCVCIFVRFLCSQNSHVCQMKRKNLRRRQTIIMIMIMIMIMHTKRRRGARSYLIIMIISDPRFTIYPKDTKNDFEIRKESQRLTHSHTDQVYIVSIEYRMKWIT